MNEKQKHMQQQLKASIAELESSVHKQVNDFATTLQATVYERVNDIVERATDTIDNKSK